MIGLVRPADVDDAAAIARVHVESWRTTYRGLLPDDFLDSLSQGRYLERWLRSLGDDATRVYVAEDAHEVVAFASGGRERAGEDGYSGELYAIYVLEGAQRQGHGMGLVRARSRSPSGRWSCRRCHTAGGHSTTSRPEAPAA